MTLLEDLNDKSTLADVRSKAGDVARAAIELRRKPADQRGDTYADDLREAIDAVNFLDSIERGLALEEREARAKAEQDERDRLAKLGLRGPTAAFADGDDHEARSPGEHFTADAGYDEWVKGGGVRNGNFSVEVRTLLTSGTSDPAAGIWRPVGQPIPPRPRQRRLFVRDLLSVQDTGLSSVPYIMELNPATNEEGAGMTAEGSAKSEVTMQFEQADAPIRKITAWLPATTEILEDAPTLRGYIDTRLDYMILLREEEQALAGAGTGVTIKGILSFSSGNFQVQTQTAVAGDVPATFAAAFGKIENVDGDPDGVAMNPLDFWGGIGTRHSTQFDNGFGGNQPAAVELGSLTWGERCVRTRALDQGTAIAGSWALGATLFQRHGVRIVVGNQHEDYLVKNKVAIVAEERVGLAVHRPDWFVNTTIDLTA